MNSRTGSDRAEAHPAMTAQDDRPLTEDRAPDSVATIQEWSAGYVVRHPSPR